MTLAGEGSFPELPEALLRNVASRVAQLGAIKDSARVCRAFYEAGLLHSPAFRIHLDRQRCDQLLTPRVVSALRARTCKLALAVDQPQLQDSKQFIQLLAHVMDKLGSCTAVECLKLCRHWCDPLQVLDCTPCLAQQLLCSFPRLTALSLQGYSVTRSGLASLLSHPQLVLQLQHLDLSRTTILEPAVTTNSLFHGVRLKQLSLAISSEPPFLPNLLPLAQHLTQLHVVLLPELFPPSLHLLPELQVLTLTGALSFKLALSQLRHLRQLRTLQLPGFAIWKQSQVDELLTVSHLTSIQVSSIHNMTQSRAAVSCSWQQLEVTGGIDCPSAAYLPLHSLTHPLQLGILDMGTAANGAVAALARNLTEACQVPVRIGVFKLCMHLGPDSVQRLAAVLQRRHSLVLAEVELSGLGGLDTVAITRLAPWCRGCTRLVLGGLAGVSAATVPALATLCRGCTSIEFQDGSLTPSLEFWCQLVQMPTISQVAFWRVSGAASVAMCESLRRMAEQPWARWLVISIHTGCHTLLECCHAIVEKDKHPAQPAIFRVSFSY
ncbi:hypothetical protein V8C86DRAFT_2650427 [Haematococcus lacustris]